MRILGFLCFLLCLSACREAGDAGPAGAVSAPPGPVTVFFNGVIHTVDEARPQVSAMAFSQSGEILLTGDSEEVLRRFPSPVTRDLQGAVVVPGLIDSHGHLKNLALSFARAQLRGTRDIDDVIRILKEHEQQLPPGDWLLGRGWDQNDWPVKEFPNREDLDTHFPDRPVLLTRVDGHASWANSAALALVDRDLSGDWQPSGGYIHRDASGRPTGIFIDTAEDLLEQLVPPESDELMSTAIDLALQHMVSLGLTGTHDPGVSRRIIEHYQEKIGQGRFPVRVYAMVEGVGRTFEWLCAQGGIADPSGRLYVRSVKTYGDGALGSRGAALLAEYSDDPGNRGLLFHEDAGLRRQFGVIMACGFQVAVHAIGDAANRQALNLFAELAPEYPDNPGRHRIEHAQVLSAEDIGRFALHDIIAAVQPTHATSDMYWAEQRLGPERVRHAYAWRSLADSGARLTLGSDFVVEEVNPVLGFYAAVTRQDLDGWPEGGWYPEQRLTREETLKGFTLDAAYAGFMEDRVGSLEPGKRADFVILDRDIMREPESRLAATTVLETWVDGQRVFSRTAP